MLKVLFIHNHYQQYGGEDTVFKQEAELLQKAGHVILFYIRTNNEINRTIIRKLLLPLTMVWSLKTYREVLSILKENSPDIVHIHNTFFMISPSVYFACKKMKIPVVQSLYNPRYMCIAGSLNRNGIVCEKCVGLTFPRYGVLFKCYRKSLILSFLVAITYFIHKSIKTFDWGINLFINATHFYHEKFIEAGINEKKMVVKPHFVFSEPFCYSSDPSDYVVYVGRLDPEKGIHTLLNAWIKLKDIPLKIRGAGQLTPQVLSAKDHYNLPIEIIENLTKEDLTKLIKSARFLVFPSEGLYETFGMVIIEAFACGTPVISSQIGVMCEIIKEKETGLFFKPGNSKDLADKVRWAFSNKEEMIKMGENARIEYQTKYTSEINYKMMMEIYSRAMIKI